MMVFKQGKIFDYTKVSFNAGLLVKEMQKRKVQINLIGDSGMFQAKYDRHTELLYDIYTSLIPYPLGWIINDKFYSKQFLQEKTIPVVCGSFFRNGEIDKALSIAHKIGYPVVMKPTFGSHGDDVYTEILNDEELKEKIHFLKDKIVGSGYLLVEKYFPGNEYRIFITKNNFFAAVWRIPANVIGDGKTNILMLIQRENNIRMNSRNTCLCEIRLDDITFDYMEKHGITLDYIPKKREKVFVRGNSNVSTGGNCYDVTDEVHPTVKSFAQKILDIFPGVPYLGIDLICPDISKQLKEGQYIVCELNSAPGLSLHMMPEKGKSRNAAGALVDLLFPETIK